MFTFIILAVTLITLVYLWQKRVYRFWTDRGIPQMPPTFPIGTVKTDENFVYGFMEISSQFKRKTKYVGLYTTLQPTLMVLDEEVIKQIMVKDFQYTQSRGMYHNEVDDPLSAHLFSIEGQKWRDLRTKLTPTFTSGKMKAMCPIVVDIGQQFKETMDMMIERGDTGVDMREMFGRFTTDVIGTCAFGLECNSLKDPDAEFRKMGMKTFTHPRYSKIVQFAIMAFPNFARKLHTKIVLDEVNDFFIKVVNDTVDMRVKNNIQRNDFMDLMIGLRNEKKSNSFEDSMMDGLSLNEIAAQSFLFFLAGFETSSTASSFTIYELAQNQDIQDKLRTHIREVLRRHNGQITYEALKDMTYLDQCINEGMRKYPPVPMLNRMTVQPYTLPFTDVEVPVNTPIIIPAYAIHHDPKNYPDPERYDPDRFTPEEVAKRHPFAYLPFGEGPRNCIGERFGMMQAKIGMVYLIGNYRFRLNSKTEPITFNKESFILTPASGLYFDVEKA